MGVVNNAWAPDLEERLRALVAQGNLSRRRIADALGVTRNAVIGKCHRLGLYSAPRRTGPEAVATPRKPRALPRPKLAPVPPSMHGLPLFCRSTRHEVLAPSEPLRVGILDLASNGCRFVVDAGLYCGHRTGAGSWCPHHARLVFLPTKKRAA